MRSLIKKIFLRIRRRVLRELVKTERGRASLEWHIFDELQYLGVGSGVHVGVSGERVLLKLLRENGPVDRPICIIDAGANQGQFLQLIREGLDGVSYQIHSFEPSPGTFEILRKNAGESPNIFLNNIGLSKARGEMELFTDEVGSGMASLYNRRLDHFDRKLDKSEKVKLETLDQYCQEHSIDQIDLLKMDVEGHESDVLNGSVQLFNDRKVRFVTFEFGGTNIDSRTFLQDFYYFFKAHGMTAWYRILPSGECQEIGAYRESLEQFTTTNFLVKMA